LGPITVLYSASTKGCAMSLDAIQDPQTKTSELERLTAQIQAVAERLSNEQILDVADLLHAMIRERQTQERSWRRIQVRLASGESAH